MFDLMLYAAGWSILVRVSSRIDDWRGHGLYGSAMSRVFAPPPIPVGLAGWALGFLESTHNRLWKDPSGIFILSEPSSSRDFRFFSAHLFEVSSVAALGHILAAVVACNQSFSDCSGSRASANGSTTYLLAQW